MSKLTSKRRELFLGVLRAGKSVSAGASAIRVSRAGLYAARARDKNFAALWDQAIEHGTDLLEDEAVRRGFKGTLRPIYQGGKRVGTIREYSDVLLIFTLKARRPGKFREITA